MPGSVNLKDPSGNLVSVPQEQANDALQTGFSQPSQQDLAQGAAQDKYGGTLGEAEAAAAGAARGVSFGLSDQALTKAGVVSPETLKGLKDANPKASTAGELAGVGGSFLIPVPGTGEAGVAAHVAQGAEAARMGISPVQALAHVGTSIAEHVAPEASGLAQKALGLGLGSAAEGAAYGLGQSVSEDALGDPNALGEKLFQNVGYGALFGGAAGVATAGLGGAFSRIFGKGEAQAAAEMAGQKAAVDGTPSIGMDDAASAAAFKMPEEISEQASKSLRPDADKTLEAAKEFGFDAQPGMLSSDKDVQFKEGTLYKSPSEAGDAVRNAYETGYQNMTKGVQDILEKQGSELSPIEQTQQIRDGMIKRVNEEAGPIQELYNKIEPEKAAIDVSESARNELAGKIQSYLDNSAPTKTQRNFINGILDDVKSLDRLDKLETYRSEFNKEAYSLVNKDSLSHVAGDITDMFDDASLNSIKEHIGQLAPGEMRTTAEGLISDMDNARAQYAGFKDTAKGISKALFNTEKVGGPRGFVRKLEEHLTDEKFMNKLFDKKNHEAFKTLQEIFPEQAEQIKTLEKSRIAAKARGAAGQDFNALTATKEILGDGRTRGMSKELREQLFSPEEIRRMDLAEHGLNRMAGVRHFNPSDSGTHIAYSGHLSTVGQALKHAANGNPLGAATSLFAKPIQEFTDARLAQKLQESVGRAGAAKVSILSTLEKQANKVTSNINSSASKLFDFGSKIAPAVGSQLIPSDDEHNETIKTANTYFNNPEKMANDLEEQSRSLYGVAPNIAGALQASAMRANNFLASKAPKVPSFGPLGPKPKPSNTEKAMFNNYVHAVKNPLHVMNKLKEGTLVPQDVETLMSVYPKMYQEMQMAISTAMLDHVDKNGVENIPNQMKVGLSLFLAQDMDTSISPQSVAANQAVLAGAAAQKDQQEQQQIARPSQKGLSALNKSQSILTNAQQVSQRDVGST